MFFKEKQYHFIYLKGYNTRGELGSSTLQPAGSTAVLFNGIKGSWRLARKILSQFTLLRFLNVFW